MRMVILGLDLLVNGEATGDEGGTTSDVDSDRGRNIQMHIGIRNRIINDLVIGHHVN